MKHLAIGKPVKVLTPYADNYSAAGDVSINDGICGSWSYSDKKWLGFLSDVDIVIDLEKSEPLLPGCPGTLCEIQGIPQGFASACMDFHR